MEKITMGRYCSIFLGPRLLLLTSPRRHHRTWEGFGMASHICSDWIFESLHFSDALEL